MNKIIKIAENFETKLKSLADMSDAKMIAKMFGRYEMMSEALDVLLEGLELNITFLEQEFGSDHNYDDDIRLSKQQKELLESAIMSVYPQINAIDAKLQEILLSRV